MIRRQHELPRRGEKPQLHHPAQKKNSKEEGGGRKTKVKKFKNPRRRRAARTLDGWSGRLLSAPCPPIAMSLITHLTTLAELNALVAARKDKLVVVSLSIRSVHLRRTSSPALAINRPLTPACLD